MRAVSGRGRGRPRPGGGRTAGQRVDISEERRDFTPLGLKISHFCLHFSSQIPVFRLPLSPSVIWWCSVRPPPLLTSGVSVLIHITRTTPTPAVTRVSPGLR